MTMHNNLRSEAMLSFVSDQPYAYHHLPSNTHIVFWLGLGMTRAQAMMMIANWKELSFIKESTILAAYEEFKMAYIHRAFGDVDWRYRLDLGAGPHYHWLSHKVNRKLSEFDFNNNFVKRHTLEQCLRALQHEEVLNT